MVGVTSVKQRLGMHIDVRSIQEVLTMSSTSKLSAGEQTTAHQSSLREKLKEIIQRYDPGDQYKHIPLQKASILLPLLIKQDKLYLLLTVRSMQLKTMPGDVCFPGGRRELTDKDDIQTALRETNEEIGLKPEQVEIIGRLVLYISKNPAYLITPVVALVEDTFQACPDPNEVTEVFHVPLDFFISSDHYTPLFLKAPYFGTNRIHSFLYNDPQMQKSFTIWGLTAHFALILSVMVLGKGPEFDTNFKLERRLAECKEALLSFYPSKL